MSKTATLTKENAGDVLDLARVQPKPSPHRPEPIAYRAEDVQARINEAVAAATTAERIRCLQIATTAGELGHTADSVRALISSGIGADAARDLISALPKPAAAMEAANPYVAVMERLVSQPITSNAEGAQVASPSTQREQELKAAGANVSKAKYGRARKPLEE